MTLPLIVEARAAGASLWLVGDEVAFRFAGKAPPGVLTRLRNAKGEVIAVLLAEEVQRWRCEHPLPASDRAACYHCGRPAPCTPVLAGSQGEHAWLHRECWAPMNEKRQREALDAVTRLLNASKTCA